MNIIYGLICFFSACSFCYGSSDWIPCTTIPSPPQVYVSSTPSITYTTQETWIARPMILSYDWVPYYTTRTTVIERNGLLCKYRTLITQPVIEWIYQPVWK